MSRARRRATPSWVVSRAPGRSASRRGAGSEDAVLAELRGQVEWVVRNIALAETAGLPYEVFLHRRRLRGLLDSAAAHGACVETWVDQAVLAPVELADG